MNQERVPVEAAGAGVFVFLVFVLFGPIWLRGLTPFWGDLTYLHHPWLASTAQRLQSGRLPLWTPELYFGMPMAANMQRAVFYPGEIPFYCFGFSTAAAIFQGFHYWLAGCLMFLWLRSLRLKPSAALAGAAVYALGGGLLSRMSFLNHLSVLSLLPMLLLFFHQPALLSLALAAVFLAGYPPFLIGGAALVWALSILLSRGEGGGVGGWLLAGLGAMALAACQLILGVELLALSRRSVGVGLEEALRFSNGWRDLARWVSPLLFGSERFNPAVDWYRSNHIGCIGALAAAWGLCTLDRRRAAGLALLLGMVFLLILGDSSTISRALWAHAGLARLVRYPGNLSYLGWPVAAILVAAGFSRFRTAWRCWALAALAGELLFYAWGAVPMAKRAIFTQAGPLVRRLQADSSGLRYLVSPLALENGSGFGVSDWKGRLYGLSNEPFHLRAAANFGEPLVPRPTYEFMDFLYRQPSAQRAALFLPGAGVRFLLTRDPVDIPPKLAHGEGRTLWDVYRLQGPASLAWSLDAEGGEDLPAGLPTQPLPSGAQPLALTWSREDRYEISGRSEGWVFIAEPRFPGWKAFLETGGRSRPVDVLPAWGAFEKVRVPAGPWRLRFFYDPDSWRAGLLLTLMSLMGLGVYWYNRALRP